MLSERIRFIFFVFPIVKLLVSSLPKISCIAMHGLNHTLHPVGSCSIVWCCYIRQHGDFVPCFTEKPTEILSPSEVFLLFYSVSQLRHACESDNFGLLLLRTKTFLFVPSVVYHRRYDVVEDVPQGFRRLAMPGRWLLCWVHRKRWVESSVADTQQGHRLRSSHFDCNLRNLICKCGSLSWTTFYLMNSLLWRCQMMNMFSKEIKVNCMIPSFIGTMSPLLHVPPKMITKELTWYRLLSSHWLVSRSPLMEIEM